MENRLVQLKEIIIITYNENSCNSMMYIQKGFQLTIAKRIKVNNSKLKHLDIF